MPPASGAKPGAATLGLAQTIRCACRRSEAFASEHARVVALPAIGDDQHHSAASHTAPTIKIHESPSAQPMRVPPDQSGISAAARASATSGLASRIARVSRVSRVPNTNTSACARRHAPEQMQVSAAVRLHRPGDVEQRDHPARRPFAGTPDRSAGSPPERMLCRSEARRSSRSPRRCRRRRRDSRKGGSTDIIRQSGARVLSSSAVSRAKSILVSLSSQLASVGTAGRTPRRPCFPVVRIGSVWTCGCPQSSAYREDRFEAVARSTGGSVGSPRDLATSTIPRNTRAKTESNAPTSAVERSKFTRAHQYSSSTVLGTSSATSDASRMVWSGETATPSSRSRSLKWASSAAVSARCHSTGNPEARASC